MADHRKQIAESSVEADAGKEIKQKHIASTEIERDRQTDGALCDKGDNRGQQAAGNGSRNVPTAQRRDPMIQPDAPKRTQRLKL